MSVRGKKTVFERLGARSAGRHSDGVESICDSMDNKPSFRFETNRRTVVDSSLQKSLPTDMTRSRKRHATNFDQYPHKRRREVRINCRPATGRQTTRPATGRQTTRQATGRQSTRLATGRQSTRQATGRQSTRPATGRQSTRPATGRQSTRPATRRKSTPPATGRQSTRLATGRQSTSPAIGGRASWGNVRGSEVRNFSNVKKHKASDTFDRRIDRNTRYQSVRRPIVGRGSSVKKPVEPRTPYHANERPGCSHWETQDRNTGVKRKAEYSNLSFSKKGVFPETNSSFRPLPKTPPKLKVFRLNVPYMLGLKDEETAVKLAAEASSLKKTLDDDAMSDERVPLILQLMEKACTGSIHHLNNLKLVILEVEKSVFFKKRIVRWIKETKLNGDTQKDVGRICTLCNAIIQHSPNAQAAAHRVSHIVDKLYFSYRTRLMSNDETLREEMLRRIEHLNSECDRVQNEGEHSLKVFADNQFRLIPVLPDIAEIRSDELPTLKASLKEGAYDSVDAYLDTTFRLLREDFVAPLRNGISSFIKQSHTKCSDKRLDDVRVYRGVHILNPVCGNDGISYHVKFSVRGWRTRQLEQMKMLCYGSLVCLSSDNFVSGLVGVVANRNRKDIKQGIIDIQFQNPVIDPSLYSKEYVMVEPIAFFEAYRPVLEGLQKITETTLPLQDYIVKTSHRVLAPEYLQTAADQTYDLSSLYKHHYRRPSLHKLLNIHSANDQPPLPDKVDDGNVNKNTISHVSERGNEDIKLASCRSNPREIDVLNFAYWPDESMVDLDDSQLRAVHAALTQKLAVIQGPPGTGKTYVGLKIMEVLLHTLNRDVWSEGESGPILVVCYTNHALDQFLEGVLKFETNIVRIGGRSQSEKLKNFNLKNRRTNVGSRSHNQRSCLCYRRHRLREEIEAEVRWALSFQTVIHNAETLKSVMNKHAQGYFQPMALGDVSVMSEWLGLQRNMLQRYRQEHIHDNISGFEEASGMADELTSVFDDTEESRLLDDEMLDDEIDDLLKKKLRREQALIVARRGFIDIKSLCKWAVKTKCDPIIKMAESFKYALVSSDMMSKDEANRVHEVWWLSNVDRWRLYRYWVDVYRTKCLVDTAEYTRKYDVYTQAIKDIENDGLLHILKRVKVIGMTTTGAAKKQSILQRVGARIVVVEEAAEVMEAHVVAALSKHCQHLILIGDHQQLRPNPAVYRLAKQYNLDISLFERMVNNKYPCQTLSRQHRMRPEISEVVRKHFYPNIQDDESVLGMGNIRGLAKNMFFINHRQIEDDDNDVMKSHSSEHEAKMVVALCKYILQQGYSSSQVTVLTTYKGQLFNIKQKLVEGGCEKVRVSVVDNYQGEECDIIILSLVRSNVEGKIGFLKTSNRVCVMLSRAKMGLYCIGNFDQLAEKSTLWKAITDDLKTKELLGNRLTLKCHLHPDVETHVECADDFKKVPEGGCMHPCTFRLLCGHSCTRLCHPDDSDHEQFICRKSCDKTICPEGHKCQRDCFKRCNQLCTVSVKRLLARCNHSVTMECFNDPELHDCQEKVLRTDLPCGHQENMPCSQALDQCPAPCKEILACGHPCTGTCRSCFSGRLHVSCKSKCGRILVCGHECSERCSSYCPPCKKNCENRCNHSQCCKKCGEPCAPCQEPCRWRCVHGEGCSKKCGEPCDRDPCNMPCTKTIQKCGHPCIGVCGEPCPLKCRVCDKDTVTEILFGNEDEDDARFVQLEDCTHVIEVAGLDKWMMQIESVPNFHLEEEDGELTSETVSIQLKGCPKCKTPIRRSTRYNKEVVKMLSDIEAVKVQVRGGSDRTQQIAQSKSEIRTMLKTVNKNFDLFASENKTDLLAEKLLREKDPSLHDINTLLNQTKFAFRLVELKQNITVVHTSDSPWCKKTLKDLLKVGTRLFNSDRPFRGTEQELIDFPNELHRLYLCCNACSLHQQMHGRTDNELSSELDRVGELLFKDCKPLTPGTEKVVTEMLKKIREGIGALGISKETKMMIVAAMGLKKGHWYKCPDGHVYAIGECGGAMEKSKCPECKAEIGGTRHKLTSGNAVATEMDGAKFPAWSEQANMGNYDIHNLDL